MLFVTGRHVYVVFMVCAYDIPSLAIVTTNHTPSKRGVRGRGTRRGGEGGREGDRGVYTALAHLSRAWGVCHRLVAS